MVALAGETITIIVRAIDPNRGLQARGKQSYVYHNAGGFYTRTTGILQTV